MDRFTFASFFETISQKLANAFESARSIRPLRTVLGGKALNLDKLMPKDISSSYKKWCVVYHPDKQSKEMAQQMREESTNLIKHFGNFRSGTTPSSIGISCLPGANPFSLKYPYWPYVERLSELIHSNRIN